MSTQYIYGNTRIRYTIAGIRIPPCENTYNLSGWVPYTAVSAAEYKRLLAEPLFGELMDTGKIRVTTIKPDKPESRPEAVKNIAQAEAMLEKFKKKEEPSEVGF